MSLSDESTSSFVSASKVSTRSISPPPRPSNLHRNTMDPSAKWLVQKFGGTSVGKFAVKIAEDIIPRYLDEHRVAIVCSARSGSTKALGTTNLLLRASSEALQRNSVGPNHPGTPGSSTPPSPAHFWGRPQAQDAPGSHSPPLSPILNGNRARSHSSPRSSSPSPFSLINGTGFTPQTSAFNATVDLLKSEHITAAKQSVNDPVLLKELIGEIEQDCEWLRGFLFAAQVIDEISPRSKDSIVGVGERLSCKLVAAILRDRGVDSEFVCLENIIPEGFAENEQSSSRNNGSEVVDQEFYDRLSVVLGERIKRCGHKVPVVTGFFGPVPGSLLKQVGRGYTDLLSALLAVGLAASELQIWKEVDGVFTADPRKVPTARLIPAISPDEAAELTYYGSEVVHPFTMEQVIRRKIPIRIKNVENPSGHGTVIQPESEIASLPSLGIEALAHGGVPFAAISELSVELEERHRRKRLPTAVTFKEHILIINVNSNRKSVSHGFLAGIFTTLDRFGVVVDLISTSEVHVSMAIEDAGFSKKMVNRLVRELEKSGSVTLHRDMAILSLVGHQMRNMVGIAGRMFSTLADGNINIEMISQGASEINISCVIESRDAPKALNLIHQSCLQINPDGPRGRGPWLF